MLERGSDSWGGVTPGWSVWENRTDASSNHRTVTAYASAVVTGYRRDPYGSGSDSNGKADLDEYVFGHARVSADTITITITIGDGEPEVYVPYGVVSHEAFVYFTFLWTDGSEHHYSYIDGDNNVSSTNYFGPYSEMTSAYNSLGHDHEDIWYLTGKGDCYISNVVENLVNNRSPLQTYFGREGFKGYASAHAEAP